MVLSVGFSSGSPVGGFLMAKRSVGDWIMGRNAKTEKTGFKFKLKVPELKVEKGKWRGLPTVKPKVSRASRASRASRTYINGKWMDTHGRWRDREGRYTSAPKVSSGPSGLPERGSGLSTGRAGDRRMGKPRTDSERAERHRRYRRYRDSQGRFAKEPEWIASETAKSEALRR